MIIGFIGKQRNGKTLLMNSIAKIYQGMGYVIVTNQRDVGYPHIFFNPEFLVDKRGIEELKRKMNTKKLIMCLDEAHLWLDSRRSRKNTAKSFFITQAGKLMEEQGHFFFTTQFFSTVDIRLRNNTNYLFNIEKIEDEGKIDFKVDVCEPRGDWMVSVKEIYFSSDDLFEDGLYNRFEMIETED